MPDRLIYVSSFFPLSSDNQNKKYFIRFKRVCLSNGTWIVLMQEQQQKMSIFFDYFSKINFVLFSRSLFIQQS